MESFIIVIVAFVMLLLALSVKHYGVGWLKTKEGKGILAGLVGAPLLAIILIGVVSLFVGGCAYTQNPYIEVFAGLERTNKISPQCEVGGADDKLTSNLGLAACTETSKDGLTTLCATYRHHSCAISPDSSSYDAGGVTVTRRVYIQ